MLLIVPNWVPVIVISFFKIGEEELLDKEVMLGVNEGSYEKVMAAVCPLTDICEFEPVQAVTYWGMTKMIS